MNKAHLRKLLDKYLNNACSESEMTELLELFKRAENETEIKAILNDYWRQLSEDDNHRNRPDAEDNDKWFNEIYSQAVVHERGMPPKTSQPAKQIRARNYSYPRKTSEWLKVAAILLFSLTATLLYYTLNQNRAAEDIAYEEKAPGPGEKIRFTLPDGTQVHLNSESTLGYKTAFNGDKREVYLQGEAYFVVASDKDRPFLVYTDDVTTKVLWTSFNVRSYPDDQRVMIAVTSGKVALSDSEISESDQEVVLEANQWADYSIESHSFQTESGDIAYLTAWNEGVLLYHDKQLRDVATQLERWYGVTISFENESMKECVIRGEHRDETLVNVLNAISYAFDMEYHIEGREVVLTGAGCDDM
jgi:transmembrane sensor